MTNFGWYLTISALLSIHNYRLPINIIITNTKKVSFIFQIINIISVALKCIYGEVNIFFHF